MRPWERQVGKQAASSIFFSFGSKLAGLLGEWSESLGEYIIFTGIAVFTILIGFLVMLILNKLKALTHGAEDIDGVVK